MISQGTAARVRTGVAPREDPADPGHLASLELNHPNTVLRSWKAATLLGNTPNAADLLDFSPERIAASAQNFVEIFGAEDARASSPHCSQS